MSRKNNLFRLGHALHQNLQTQPISVFDIVIRIKKISSAILCYSLMQSAAMAGTSATLTVTGRISPPSCSISLENNGRLDFGSTSFNSLNIDGTQLAPKTVALNIVCEAPTRVGLAVVDSRSASKIAQADVASSRWASALGDDWIFGLGTTGPNDQVRIGGMMIGFQDGTVRLDEANAKVMASTNRSSWSSDAKSQYLSPKSTTSWSRSGADTPLAAKLVNGTLVVTPTIARTVSLPSADTIELDGSVTLDLVYL
ncbi:DUF1120 domain-containing protein [Burkholderia gladioli]|uniref:DUF1120 domain-containing protein n=1 Tax=Burkholderia gladioli TaxID=28095 RepID=UPI0015E7101E|nr:DUF1120 domain-containing protein [Burkholderia gladioli]MBA1363024.1 DUF1120 domain-containing protein [Burkholderia gladioli]MDN7808497.1 DUF1120 domain-containing protein [Burkholderia gladioli]